MHKALNIIGIYISLFYLSGSAYGQKIEVKGGFLKDTVLIGEDIAYYLSVAYPRNMLLIFPDSSYDYSPFEYYGKNYFSTRSDSVFSHDSVIYHLATFDLDTFQSISLPVYRVEAKDSLPVYAPSDSVYLQHLIVEIPDSIALKTNTSFLKIPVTFNYPLITILILLGSFTGLLVFLFFGKKIFRWIQVMHMKRRHKNFVEKFYVWLRELRDNRNTLSVEQILNEWKKYLEKLEKQPYTKMTTREILSYSNHYEISDNLKSIDRFIYGNMKDSPLHRDFERLLDYSIDRYKEKLYKYGYVR